MKWLKSGAWGFVLGSIITMIVGFNWGGWTTGGPAERTAVERSSTAVTAALVPVCLEKAKADPARAEKVEALKALTSSYEQKEAVLKWGWASVGESEANGSVAEACASQLVTVAAKK